MRIAIDFDGVIHDHKNPVPGKRMGAPLDGAKEALEKLKRDNNIIIIHSVRGDSPQHIRDWMEYYGIPFDEITRMKPDDVAFFIDDHALRFEGDWYSTLTDMALLDDLYQSKKRHDTL